MRSRALLFASGLLLCVMALATAEIMTLPAARSQPRQADPALPDASPLPPGTTGAGRERWLVAELDQVLAGPAGEGGPLASARVGVHVADVASGKVLYSRKAEEPYSVASCAKIITAAAALHILGPRFQPRTQILGQEIDRSGTVVGDLYLRGRGDPGLGIGDLERLADALVRAGITAVRGRLVVDDSYFDRDILPPHFDEQPDEDAAFRAPVSALSPSYNAFWVVVRPARSGRGLATVALEPPGDYARIDKNELVTQTSGRNRVRLATRLERKQIAVTISGQLRANVGVRRYRRRVPDPVVFVGSVFGAMLAERRIALSRKPVMRGVAPEDATVLAEVAGAPVAVSVRSLGKFSNNFVAETLLKTIGAETRPVPGPATWSDGLTAVRGFLTDRVGLAPGSYRYSNGSGLFDATELSPAQLVQVLVAAGRDARYGPDFVASLAIFGVDGTLRRRSGEALAAGLVRGKTGTLARVTALAGYAATNRLRPVAFAVVVNDLPERGKAARAARRAARRVQDHIADALISYLGESRSARPSK